MNNLNLLPAGHAGHFEMLNGEVIPYGTIRVEKDSIVYYTGKGLREICPQKPTPEQKEKARQLSALPQEKLIELGYIAVTPFSKIQRGLN